MDTQKRIIIWASAILVLLVAAIGAWQVATGPREEGVRTNGTLSLPLDQSDWTKGAASPVVTFVEYSDYQCPACAAYYPLLEEMVAEYKDRISFTYRHFPLPQHKEALYAAYAAEAAGKQGKFWEMNGMLFEKQSEWSERPNAQAVIEGYALQLGLDVIQFRSDMKSSDIKAKVERDRKSGQLSGIDHTPTFFLNGKMATNPRSKEELKALIEDAIAHL